MHPRRPEQSVVLGALKEGGLAAFDLNARQLALPLRPARTPRRGGSTTSTWSATWPW
ncbi:hypothetical protein [Amycolatopsis sp. H20-H5]|uniref:hypothetical protein n=1 Tax=Amycolatopsis sp. H20-H5 TaxID=3046309 RepID=UPI002DBA9998|nr:hypothetical protein [Amycolatopsis sp. H20-H5]MEC3980052.1 hypothetical protein [Amycolatopsis sp. H20-H5]